MEKFKRGFTIIPTNCILKKVKLKLNLLAKGKKQFDKRATKKEGTGIVIKQGILEKQVKIVYLSIGSNLGNRIYNIERSKYKLSQKGIKIINLQVIMKVYHGQIQRIKIL